MGTKQKVTNREILRLARLYRAYGLSIIPIKTDGLKAPACGSWNPYRERIASHQEICEWFPEDGDEAECGIGIVGGNVSGNLEILDIDNFDLAKPFMKSLKKNAPDLYRELPRVKTPRPGLHLYYRLKDGEPKSQKRARKRVEVDGKCEIKTLIETKGEGGYVLAPGNPSSCHTTGRSYQLLKGLGLDEIQVINEDHHQLILQTAADFDEIPAATKRLSLPTPKTNARYGASPIDDFNIRESWENILGLAGWTIVRIADDEAYWKHPRATGIWSAVTGPDDGENPDWLRVFSENTLFESIKESGHGYSKFDAFRILHCGGNFNAALYAVRKAGFGEPRPMLSFMSRPPGRATRKNRNY